MSEQEEFLARWSRRKRQSTQPADIETAQSDATSDDDAALEEPLPPKAPPSDLNVFDVSALPPIESINADTDIRAFLAPGVPAELTRAALRRAWAADAKIRDFVGLAESAWDFNAPGGMPGFGPLEITEEWQREIAAMFTRDPSSAQDLASTPGQAEPESIEAASDEVPTSVAPEAPSQASAKEPTEGPRDAENAAMQNGPNPLSSQKPIVQRSHGGALPKPGET
jgi:hypothetical protein